MGRTEALSEQIGSGKHNMMTYTPKIHVNRINKNMLRILKQTQDKDAHSLLCFSNNRAYVLFKC